MYIELYKSIYRQLRRALVFRRKVKQELIEYGFRMKLYDPFPNMRPGAAKWSFYDMLTI